MAAAQPTERTDATRAPGYDVLASLLEHGANGVEPDLARLFDPSVDPEQLRSQYVAAFDLGVPPFASAFLEADRCVGSAVTAVIGDRMGGRAGADLAACHVAAQFRHVAGLLVSDQGDAAAVFVHDVILAWLPALSVVLEEQAVPFWAAVVRQALDLASDHAGARAPAQWSVPLHPAEVAKPLGEKSGLADIAQWLSTPAAVGTFISDHDLVAIGRVLELPRGFGSRPQRIETLLRSAVDYGALSAATDGIAALLQRRREALLELSKTHVHLGVVTPWLQRLETGLEVIATLAEAARHEDEPSEA